jgi:DNA modification methylase
MSYRILQGDVLERLRDLPSESVHCVVTSPPYWGLRDYGTDGQIGLEKTPAEFIAKMVAVFREVRRVLRSDGTCWVNMGDSYAGSWGNQGRKDERGSQRPINGEMMQPVHDGRYPANGSNTGKIPEGSGLKPKDLCGMPWRLAFALQDDGWWLRQDIIWAKPSGMPGSQVDRCTSSHEHIFLLAKSAAYWSDFDAIKTPPRESSLVRLAQDIQAQAGSHRANGGAKTNGTMKAVGKTDKQRGHGRRHDGFNDRWDAMKKEEQQSQPAMMRDVWFVSPGGYGEAHFAVMPEEIAKRCILAGSPKDGTVLDPFNGSGTTGVVALRYHRNYIGIELNPEYVAMAENRIQQDNPMFNVQVPA